VKMTEANFGQFTVYYGTFDGKLIVTSGDAAVAKLRASGSKLADSKAYKDAKETAGVPDETAGFIYMNLAEGIPMLERYVRASGSAIPPIVTSNLAPLKSLFAWAELHGHKQKGSLFLRID